MEKEKELIQSAAFVATTASKATVDKAVNMQSFDVVIFDEAILIGNDKEAEYLMDRFSEHKQKFHDMTGDEFSIHRTSTL